MWKRCSTCKTEIPYNTKFWICSVSTCRSQRKGLVFCQVSCWDAHLSILRHREAWAEEKISPSKEQHSQGQGDPFVGANPNKPKKEEYEYNNPIGRSQKKTVLRRSKSGGESMKTISGESSSPQAKTNFQKTSNQQSSSKGLVTLPNQSSGGFQLQEVSDKDVLIVASKLKKYIKDRSGGMSTSQAVLDRLSHLVRELADEAILSANRNERKTVMDRDFLQTLKNN